jgi:hypothetical protein
VNDIAQQDELGGMVFGHEGGKAVDGVVRSGDWEQLAGVTMRPGVAEMEVGGDEGAFLRQPDDAAGVEVERGGEGVEVGRGCGGGGVDGGIVVRKFEIRNPDYRYLQRVTVRKTDSRGGAENTVCNDNERE